PGTNDLVDEILVSARVDSAGGLVPADIALPEGEGGLGLGVVARAGGVAEAVQLGELDGADLGGDHAQRAPGLDRLQLTVITDEADLRPDGPGVAHELLEVEGAGHSRLVDEDDIAGAEREPLRDGVALAGAAAPVQPL